MPFLKKLSFMGLVIFGAQLCGLPISGDVFKSKDGLILAIGDAHPSDGCTKQQAEDLVRVQLAHAAKALNAFVICEDMAYYDGANKPFATAVNKINARALKRGDSSISFMMKTCKTLGVQCWNAEFRHFKTPSICNEPSAKVGDVVKAVAGAAAEMLPVQGKQTHPAVKAYTDKAMNELFTGNNACVFLELLQYDAHKTMADLLKDIRTADKVGFDVGDKAEQEEFMAEIEQEFQLCDLRLFDARVAHKLGELMPKEKVIILHMGNGHIKNLCPLFAQLGYVHMPQLSVRNKPNIVFNNEGVQIDAGCSIDISKFFLPFLPSQQQKPAGTQAAAGSGAGK